MDSKSNLALGDSLLNEPPRKESGSVEMSRKPASLANQADFPQDILDNNDKPNDNKRLLQQTELNIEEKNPDVGLSRATSLKRGLTSDLRKKETSGESYIDLSDLLPEGVESVEQLRKMFEEKRDHKRRNHLDWMPKVHQGDVLCLIFSPDYRFILSSSADHSIKALDAETKQEVFQIKEAHEESVNVIAITSDMKYLISGSDDKSIKVFDFATRQLIHHFKDAHEDPVISLCITSDNKYIISGTQKGSVKIFDLSSKKQIHHFTNFINEEEGDTLKSMKVTPNSKLLVILTEIGFIIFFDLIKKVRALGFEGDSFKDVSSIAITPDSRSILAGTFAGPIKVISIADKKEIYCFNYEPEGHMRKGNNEVIKILFSSDGQEFFVGFWDGSIQRINLKTKEKKLLQEGVNKNQPSIHIINTDPKEKSVMPLQRPSKRSVNNLEIALAVSSDSKYIISAMASKSIKIIDSETKQQVFQDIFTSDQTISSLAISPNSKWIIAGFANASVVIWDFQNQIEHHKLENISSRTITRLAVTPDSCYVIVELLKSFIMFDIIQKKEVHRFSNAHTGQISGLAVTPDSKFIVSSSYDRSVKLYDLATKKQIHHFQDVHKGEIFGMIVSLDSKYIITASRDFSIKILDIETKNLVHEFVYAHDNSIFGLAVSSDSRYLASSSADHSVKVFDIVTKQLVYSLQNLHSNWAWALAFAPNDKFIISAAFDDSLKFINFETITGEKEIKTEGQTKGMALSPNDELLALTSETYLRVFNVKTKEQVLETVIQGKGKSLVFSPDSKVLVFGTMAGTLGAYDIENKKYLFSNTPHIDRVYSVVVTPDNRFIISGSQDKSIKISDLQTGELLYHFKDIHQESVRSLKLTPDGKYLISASADKTIKIIDIEERKQVYSFTAHLRWIKCVDISSDGKFFASCSDDRSIKIFDWKTKQLIHWFKNAHDNFINSVAISRDCRFIVSGSSDRSVKVFDIQTKQLVHTFREVHTQAVKHVAITADNKYIISASYDGVTQFLRLTPTEPLHQKTNQSTGIITQNNHDVSNSDFYYVYNGFSHYLNFNAVDDFIFNPNIPIKTVYATAIRCQNLTVFPYKWNVLHLLAIRAQHNFIKNLPGYAQFKVPFLLDAFNRTPLHYLLAHERLNSASVNFMLNYICDFLEHLTLHHPYQAQEIIIAMTPLFWFILTKTDIKVRERFLTICSIPPPVPYTAELPDFGVPKSDIATFQPTLESIFPATNEMWENGEDQIDFRMNIVNLDYNVLSSDMEKTIKCLSQQKNEEVFRTNLIIDLINHLWDQTKFFLEVKFALFLVYIVALSIYLSLEYRFLPFELFILACAGAFALAEVLQAISLKQDYFADSWNMIDMLFHPLTIAFVAGRMLGLENELVRAWISTIILLFGYLRFISYLRIFKPTRSLIQVVVTVVNDMKSFIIIIALIIIGFSFIFLVFNRGNIYGFYLYNAYGSLFGPVDDSEASASEKFFIALVAFLLNVILLNLLISIMGDSYAKVLEKRIKTDSLTRLEMISEAAALMRFFGKNETLNKGFLVICESLNSADNDEEDDAVDPWEERIVLLRALLKQNQELSHTQLMGLQQNLAETEEKRKGNEERLQEKVSSLEIELEKMRIEQEKARQEQVKQNEKTNEILALLTEMKQQMVKEPPK